ncbi:CheF family chemotaxis protein [Halobacteria archaeon AArc-dxtr1]|nr:CheF family chemotaxis protein [Halobacteria archaeon AArc-dxtr1]
MGEDVVSDITGRFLFGGRQQSTPVEGRIIATTKRVVLATAEDKRTIPLSAVVDVNVGKVPSHAKQFFQDTVTIGYTTDDELQTAVIESVGQNVEQFLTALFRTLLDDQRVDVKHPARVGGRVKDAAVVPGKLTISPGEIAVKTNSGTLRISIATVMGLDRTQKIGDDTNRVTLSVKHTDESGRTQTTLIAPRTSRHVNLLARYLRLEYDEIRSAVDEIDLTDAEKQVLVGIHATNGDLDFATLLDGDSTYVAGVLNSVREKNLVRETGNELGLTPRGRIVVTHRIEDVNA